MSDNKPARIHDVAMLAGVSIAAVSRFLNGTLVLPPATASRIEAAISTLNYRPNASARRLSVGSSETLGLIVPDISYSYYGVMASAAEAEALEHGYSLAVFNSRNDPRTELLLLDTLSARQVDGIIFTTNHADDGTLRDKINSSGRTVIMDEDVPGTLTPKVFADNLHGGLLATRHLIAKGHRRIGFLSGPAELLTSIERLQGYRVALDEAGIQLDSALLVFGHYDERFGSEGLAALWDLSERPTAIFASSDLLAIGVIRRSRELGINIPADVSVVSFDDVPYASLLDPALTTVNLDIAAFARRGVQMLVSLIENDGGGREILPVRLVERQSVAPLG